LQPGDTVVVQGPLGHYLLDAARPAVLVAGGIGITPLKGMAEYAADGKLPIPVRLVYSSRTVEEIVYREELEALERSNPSFRVLHTLTRPGSDPGTGRTGRVGADLLAEAAEGLDRPVYYLCGAPGFVEASFRSLASSGVPEADTRFEVFRGYTYAPRTPASGASHVPQTVSRGPRKGSSYPFPTRSSKKALRPSSAVRGAVFPISIPQYGFFPSRMHRKKSGVCGRGAAPPGAISRSGSRILPLDGR
jgi:ferredoxin-NADP reductase